MGRKDLFIIAIGSVLFAFLLSNIFSNRASEIIISPLAENFEKAKNVLLPQNSAQIKSIVDHELADSTGTYAIVIKNLKTHETFTQNEDSSYEPASLYKLWVMAEAFKQINEGTLLENKTMTREIAELNRIFKIAPVDAEATSGAITRTVGEATQQMIVISDNYSALLLAAQIGNTNIANFMQQLGLSNSKLGSPPITTAADIALFYENLYRGEVINKEYSDRMIEILAKQQLNDRIPKYLPNNVSVAHKTGELGNFKHDAGIIFGKNPILIVVLSETNSPQAAAERIAHLSKNVYYYFESK